MGLFDRMKTSVSHKLDGPPEPPPHVWPADQAWARVLVSVPPRVNSENHGASVVDSLVSKASGIPYRFELEVHRPGQAPYTIARDTRVPGKVEGAVLGQATTVPVGAEAPLQVTGHGAEDVELDWDAYLAIPHQADRTYHLRVKAGNAQVAKNVSPQVEQSAQAVMMLAQGVAGGTMTREMFDQQVDSLRELGYPSDEGLQAALAVING